MFKLVWPSSSFSRGQTMQPTQSRSESELWKQANLLFALQHRVYIKIAKASVYIGILFIFLPSRLYSRGGDNLILVKTSPNCFTVLYSLRQSLKKKKKSQSVTIRKNTWHISSSVSQSQYFHWRSSSSDCNTFGSRRRLVTFFSLHIL